MRSLARAPEVDRLAVPRRAHWVHESIAGSLFTLFERFQDILQIPSGPGMSLLQKQIHNVLEFRDSMSRPPVSVALILGSRKLWAGIQVWHSDQVPHYSRNAGDIAPFACAANLSHICNGWCTSARINQRRQVCRFGCKAMGGRSCLALLIASLMPPALEPSLGLLGGLLGTSWAVSYTHLRAHETGAYL
eukprot:8234239-Pyramimonas_sp.AAC.1